VRLRGRPLLTVIVEYEGSGPDFRVLASSAEDEQRLRSWLAHSPVLQLLAEQALVLQRALEEQA
jgi:hypothetical protein